MVTASLFWQVIRIAHVQHHEAFCSLKDAGFKKSFLSIVHPSEGISFLEY